MTYKAKFPLCYDMSAISYIVTGNRNETKEQEALAKKKAKRKKKTKLF